AAGRGFDQERIPDLLAERDDLHRGADGLGRAGDDGDAGRPHRLPGAGLRAHELDRGRRRPDPGQARRLDGGRERRILCEEPISRVDGLGRRAHRGLEQLVDDEVALCRRRAAERVRLVCIGHVRRVPVGVRVHSNGADSELSQGPEDAQGDLAPVRDQDFGEHTPYSPGMRRRLDGGDRGGLSPAGQLTVARAAAVPLVVALFAIPFENHDYWATGVFCAAMATDWFDGRIARRSGRSSPLGSLLDPVADKLLVMATLIVLLDQGVFPAWMVAAIVARELLISGLRQAAVERGVVIAARDLGKLKTWSQAIAAAVGGLAAAGLWSTTVSWWALLVALVL